MINGRRVFLAAVLGIFTLIAISVFPCAAQTEPASPAPALQPSPWRQMLEMDLDYLKQAIHSSYIYAVYPGGAEWAGIFERAWEQARGEAALVNSFAGYRAVMKHFVVSFEDPHFSVNFHLAPSKIKWPGFLVRYKSGRCVVVESRIEGVRVGDVIESCDGETMDQWIDKVARFESPTRGSMTATKVASAPLVFQDAGSPLYSRPKRCRIGGRDIELVWTDLLTRPADAWTQIGNVTLQQLNAAYPAFSDESVSVTPFAEDGAWVRIGTCMPDTQKQADEFNRLIEEAPSLREKKTVVIDVRGNRGGNYNWFMAFLRAFYGAEYADYYALARLEIANVVLNVSKEGDVPQFTAEANAIKVPPDPQMELAQVLKVKTLANGVSNLIIFDAPIAHLPARPAEAPPLLVKGRVYVLTDTGCYSACLSLIDELRRFPGVIQIGVETAADRRSGGWPDAFEFPSGLGFVRMGRMVRSGRARGENESWIPTYAFDGDIADTTAVKEWIINDLLALDRSPS